MIMCFGPYHAELFDRSFPATVMQMGYPRFDRFFNERYDKEGLYRKYECDPSKPCIVWLPTWRELSSIGLFSEEISALREKYNVVVKTHPGMREREPERIQELEQVKFTCLITDAQDNMPLYQLADFIIADYGGSPMASIYTDKPLLLLNVPGASNDSLTGEASPDIEIRRHLVSVNHTEKTIAEILDDPMVWEAQASVRRALREVYFAPYFGFSSEVAANTLRQLPRLFPNSLPMAG